MSDTTTAQAATTTPTTEPQQPAGRKLRLPGMGKGGKGNKGPMGSGAGTSCSATPMP